MAESEELLMENIQEFVYDENRIVTSKWLSLTLRIHINVAKQALCNFVHTVRNKGGNDDVNVTYFVAGLGETKLGEKVLKCVIVPETELETVKSSLTQVTSCHIYSIQKVKLKDYTPLYQTDYDVIKDNLCDAISFSAIKCPWASKDRERNPQPIAAKESLAKAKAPKQENPAPVSPPPSKDSGGAKKNGGQGGKHKPSHIASMFANAGKKEKKEISKAQESEKESPPKSKETKKSVMSFFKPQPENSEMKAKSKERHVEESDKKTSDRTVSASRKQKTKDVSEDAGPERKRRRIRTDLFDSSDEEYVIVQEEEEEEALRGEEEPPPAAFEDPDWEKEEKEVEKEKEKEKEVESISSKGDQKSIRSGSEGEVTKRGSEMKACSRKRKRIRRLVPKQHIDEDGFMVTEKVWESDSTDASEEEDAGKGQRAPSPRPKPQTKNSSAASAKLPAGTKKKATKASPSKNKQTSLTSFFKKK